ncbi:hypothetical protein ACHAWT_000818 [Skeletonema menzelii]
MVLSNRHAKAVDEEHCALLSLDGGQNNASSHGATTTKSTHTRSPHNAYVNDSRLSTAILVCCVFLLGALFGSHSSSSGSVIATIKSAPRDVHVGSMCRCGSEKVAMPDVNKELISIYQQVPKANVKSAGGQDTRVIQLPTKATGGYTKRFLHHPLEGCNCFDGDGRIMPDPTLDKFMARLSQDYFLRPENQCIESEAKSQFNWDQMPDFGVEDLPIFVGVLSFEAPLTLNNTLHNWLKHDLFHRIAAQDVMVQLNHRSREDDEIVYDFLKTLNNKHPMMILGSEEENLHPGLAISKFCRRADEHPSSHPNDWVIPDGSGKLFYLESIFRSAIALSQRGVPYISLRSNQVDGSKTWNCPAEGIGWGCTTSHQHRWTNHPVLISCNWFLRYLEPFALLSDPIMYCGSSFVHRKRDGYCDWEETLQDGRVAWTNSQWVLAHLGNSGGGPLFVHQEIDK